MRPSAPGSFLALVALALVAGCSGSGSSEIPDDDLNPGPPISDESVLISPSTISARSAQNLVVGEIDASRALGPLPDSPISGIRRDCGSSVPIGELLLWVYCDTVLYTSEDQFRFFLNTSATWSSLDDPLKQVERLDPEDQPLDFLRSLRDYPPCEPTTNPLTWPTSSVQVPEMYQDQFGQALVFYEHVCAVPGGFLGYDSALGSIRVSDAAIEDFIAGQSPPIVNVTPVESHLFERGSDGQPPFGQAAVVHSDHLYVYRCPKSDHPCYVARAQFPDIITRDEFQYWNGHSWQDDFDPDSPMEMPNPVRGLKPSVEWIDSLEMFVLADHQFRALSNFATVNVRFAAEPQGPWSEPQTVELPDCQTSWPRSCFAVELHNELSTSTDIAISWFDPSVSVGDNGSTRFALVPVSIEN